MNKIITLVAVMSLGINLIKAPVPFEATSLEERAEAAGMTVEEFTLISGVVEAESNRSTDGDLLGRELIALTILNRVEDERFGCDSITEVLTAPGQFSTVVNGQSVVDRTDYSDEAVILAVEWLESGEAPNVEFFNCIFYFRGYPAYDYVGGNYFSLGG